MIKNTAGQKVGAQLILAADGTAFTGAVTVAVTVDAGAQATGSVGSGACAHEGNGYHTYAPAQAETNGDLIAFTFTGTGAVPETVQVYTRATAPDVNVLQLSGDATAADNAEAFFDGTGYAGTNNVIPLVTTSTNVTTVNGLAANVITAASIATDALTAAKLAADAGVEIAAAVWDRLTSALTGVGSVGKLIVDDLDATVSSRASQASLNTVDDFLDTEIAAILAAVDTEVAAILADTNELQVDWADGGRLDLILDARASQASVNTIDDFLDTEIATILAAVDTEIATILSTLGTPAAASIAADLVVIDDFVDALEGRLTAALATKLAAHAAAVLVFVVNAGSSTTTVVLKTVEGAAGSAVDDFYNGAVIVFTSGALSGQRTGITDYVGATKTATVVALTGTPAEDVTGVIV